MTSGHLVMNPLFFLLGPIFNYGLFIFENSDQSFIVLGNVAAFHCLDRDLMGKLR